MNAPSDVTVADWYAIPYGWPGFIGYLVGLHVLVCAQNSSTPLLPTWEFRYHRFNNMLATIQAFGCAALYGLAYSMYSQLNFEGRSDLILIMLATFLNSSIKMTVLRAKASQSALTSANYKLVDSEHGGGGDIRQFPFDQASTDSDTRETSAVTTHRDRSKPSSSNLMKPHEMTIGQAIVACCIIFSPMIWMMIGTYLALQDLTFNQNSSQVVFIWGFIIVLYTASAVSFAIFLLIPLYLRYRIEGWPMLRNMTVARVSDI